MTKRISEMNIGEFADYYKDLCERAYIDTTDENLMSTIVIKYLEELKNLLENYKNVSEAFMKTNNAIFDTRMELNKVSQELKIHKKAYEMVCDSLSDKTSCNWGYDEACKACQEESIEVIKTTSCADHIKKHYLQKASEE